MPKCIHVKGREKKKTNSLCQKCSEENANGDASISKEETCPRLAFIFFKSVSGNSLTEICWLFIRPENQRLGTCAELHPLILCKGTFAFTLKCEELSPLKVITEALGTKSPSCSLQEPSLPDGFLHSSPKIWPLLWHCCHLKAVLWRFLKFRRGWDTPTDLGRFRFNSRAAALGSCQPSALAGCRTGRWQEAMAKAELQNQQKNTLRSAKAGSKCYLSQFKWFPTPGRSVDRNLGRASHRLQRKQRTILTPALSDSGWSLHWGWEPTTRWWTNHCLPTGNFRLPFWTRLD